MFKPVAISLRDVHKRFHMGTPAQVGIKNTLLHLPAAIRALRNRKPFHAVDGISLEIYKGECFGIIGKNGCGKSTTLSLMAGVIQPTTGTVEIHGRVCPLLELNAGFHDDLTGRENIMLNGVLMGMTRAEVARKVDAIIEFSELGEFIDHPVRIYSSGMRIRLGFSVAVHLEPDVLLIDEVLAVGDTAFQMKCMAKMREFRDRGVTMVFVTHAMGDITRICNRAAYFKKGRIDSMGDPAKIVDRYMEDSTGSTDPMAQFAEQPTAV